jgi:pimeloyl-ACP methyl ester carboxylesterase
MKTMIHSETGPETGPMAHIAAGLLDRRALLEGAGVVAGALSMGVTSAAAAPAAAFDPKAEAKRIAFERSGNGENVLLISGFPQTRRSWNKIVPLLSTNFRTVAADLPSFGDSGLLSAPATTENAGRIFHEFAAANLGTPLHVVAHDFGAWVAYSWALLFPDDFKSLTLIDAGIPGVTLTEDVQLSDYKRKWNFIFQMLPDLPAELTKGKEDVYVGWWFKNKVYRPGAIDPEDAAAYARAYAREGRMDAAFDYCRQIIADMEFNKRQFRAKSPIRLLAVGGDHAIPNMGEALKPYFENVTSLVVADCGHFVPEEQPAALARALTAFLKGESSR